MKLKNISQPLVWIGIVLVSLIILSIILTLFTNGFFFIRGWTAFLWVSILSSVCLLAVWRLMVHAESADINHPANTKHPEPNLPQQSRSNSRNLPVWLIYLVIAAALLRLAVGVFWTISLPVWGHGTPAEVSGYVMGDAAGRDQAAWRLAHSRQPLLNAFKDNRKVDQYGGLLFVSAWIYRYLGSDTHQPLLIVLFGSACSALAVLFTYAFTRRIWGESAAAIAAWAMFLYPEAVLLGSSQMREAFTIPLAIAAFYGLARFREDQSNGSSLSVTSLAWILIPFLITLFFSSLSAVMLLGVLGLFGLVIIRFDGSTRAQPSDMPDRGHPSKKAALQNLAVRRRRWVWLIVVMLALVALAGLWLALREVTPARITNPIAMLSWWLRKSASFQAYLSEHSSGWMQKIFDHTPEWTHLPMLLAYGVVQPFFPAALVAGSEAPIWRWVAVWRSIGWTILLAFLAFAPFHAFGSKTSVRKNDKRILSSRNQIGSKFDSVSDHHLMRIMTVVIWLVILVAAFRGGSDMWDNPRYRAIFAGIQIALAAKIFVVEDRTRDPWLRRALLMVLAILGWFIPWYLRRYYAIPWPISDPFRVIWLGICSGVLLALADWARLSARMPAPESIQGDTD